MKSPAAAESGTHRRRQPDALDHTSRQRSPETDRHTSTLTRPAFAVHEHLWSLWFRRLRRPGPPGRRGLPRSRSSSMTVCAARCSLRGPRRQPYPHVPQRLANRAVVATEQRAGRTADELSGPSRRSNPAATVKRRLDSLTMSPNPIAHGHVVVAADGWQAVD